MHECPRCSNVHHNERDRRKTPALDLSATGPSIDPYPNDVGFFYDRRKLNLSDVMLHSHTLEMLNHGIIAVFTAMMHSRARRPGIKFVGF